MSIAGAGQGLLSRDEVESRVKRVAEAPTEDFIELLRIAELDPGWDLRFFDGSDVDFTDCDLRRFDFTGANLMGCRFEGALIVGARFEMAQMDRASLRRAKDWSDYERSWTRPLKPLSGRHLADLAVFSDAPFAPEMVTLPTGEFWMGLLENEEGRSGSQGPQHRVTIEYRFAIGRYPVTFDEYDHFCAVTKRKKPEDEGWGRGRRPVINVSWRDAPAYCEWLAEMTGNPYRLPSEAEWEYACHAGTTTPFSFGETITKMDANFGKNVGRTTEVGAYPANPWGLYDMHGNVREWVADAWDDSYEGAPADGSAWTPGEGRTDHYCPLRGGSWLDDLGYLRSTRRIATEPDSLGSYLGFRVARTLD